MSRHRHWRQSSQPALIVTNFTAAIMGKKRKASSKASGEPKEYNENTKMHIKTYEDVADSEDEFYLNQDKILLDEGPQAKKLRKWKEEGVSIWALLE